MSSYGVEMPDIVPDCYRLDSLQSDLRWQKIQPLPVTSSSRDAAVAFANLRVWYFIYDRVYDHDVRTGEYESQNAGYRHSDYSICTVTNGNYTYVIGVGHLNQNIYVNQNSEDISSWMKVSSTLNIRRGHACLMYDSHIMITGGIEDPSSVEVFNTEDNISWSLPPMLTGRKHHKMMLYDGYPTVVGGESRDNRALSDLESYDFNTGRWFTQEKHLREARYSFGLAEIRNN